MSFLKNRSNVSLIATKRLEVCLCRAISGKLFVGQELIHLL